jgi:site-specific recombinase XerD
VVVPTEPLGKRKRTRIERAAVSYLTAAEAGRLLQCVEGGPRGAALLMLGLGLRVSEAIRVRWRDLYQEGDRIGLQITGGRGGRSRILAIPHKLFCELQALRRADGLPDAIDSHDKRLIVNHGGQPYTRQRIHQVIRSAARKAGIHKRVGLHVLRHSFSTLAVRKGVSVTDLQAILGHQRIESTQFYIDLVKGLENRTTDAVVSEIL